MDLGIKFPLRETTGLNTAKDKEAFLPFQLRPGPKIPGFSKFFGGPNYFGKNTRSRPGSNLDTELGHFPGAQEFSTPALAGGLKVPGQTFWEAFLGNGDQSGFQRILALARPNGVAINAARRFPGKGDIGRVLGFGPLTGFLEPVFSPRFSRRNLKGARKPPWFYNGEVRVPQKGWGLPQYIKKKAADNFSRESQHFQQQKGVLIVGDGWYKHRQHKKFCQAV